MDDIEIQSTAVDDDPASPVCHSCGASGPDILTQPHACPQPGEAGASAELIAPSPKFSAAFLRSAIAERPWAIRRSWLATMLRADGLPVQMPQHQARTVAQSSFERCDGVMLGTCAVIPVLGVISQRSDFWSWLFGGVSIDDLRGALREALADPNASSVIFVFASPGGSVDGVPEFAAEIRSARNGSKPIVAMVDTLCASAAAWLAWQCNEVVITPSGEIGSVGVWAAHEDDSAMLAAMGVKVTLVSAGPYKTEGNSYEPLGDDARAAIQDQVDTFYAMFLGDVAKGRGTSVATIAASYGQGRTLLASKALAAGMVDRIDTLEATVRRLQPKKAPASARAAVAIDPLQSPALAASGHTTISPDRAWNRRMKGKLR